MFVTRRSQRLNLLASSDNLLVRLVELSELIDQAGGDAEGFGLIQHEVPQEHVEIAQVLGGLRFVQQAQCTLVLDAQQPAKTLLVGAELREMGRAGVGKAGERRGKTGGW